MPSGFVAKPDHRPLRLEIVNGDVVNVEEQREAGVQARGDEILHDLRLAIDDNRAPAREVAERDAVALAVELELDAVMHDALSFHAIADSEVHEQVGDPACRAEFQPNG